MADNIQRPKFEKIAKDPSVVISHAQGRLHTETHTHMESGYAPGYVFEHNMLDIQFNIDETTYHLKFERDDAHLLIQELMKRLDEMDRHHEAVEQYRTECEVYEQWLERAKAKNHG